MGIRVIEVDDTGKTYWMRRVLEARGSASREGGDADIESSGVEESEEELDDAPKRRSTLSSKAHALTSLLGTAATSVLKLNLALLQAECNASVHSRVRSSPFLSQLPDSHPIMLRPRGRSSLITDLAAHLAAVGGAGGGQPSLHPDLPHLLWTDSPSLRNLPSIMLLIVLVDMFSSLIGLAFHGLRRT